jgi:hypothetical protein
MGYAALNISFDNMVNTLFEKGKLIPTMNAKTSSQTYANIFKRTLDFDDIETLEVISFIGSSNGANAAYLEVKINSVQRLELSGTELDINIAMASMEMGTIDCSALTGNLVLEINIKGSGGSDAFFKDIQIWHLEAT